MGCGLRELADCGIADFQGVGVDPIRATVRHCSRSFIAQSICVMLPYLLAAPVSGANRDTPQWSITMSKTKGRSETRAAVHRRRVRGPKATSNSSLRPGLRPSAGCLVQRAIAELRDRIKQRGADVGDMVSRLMQIHIRHGKRCIGMDMVLAHSLRSARRRLVNSSASA